MAWGGESAAQLTTISLTIGADGDPAAGLAGDGMTPEKWRKFAISFVVFVIVASVLIYDQGGFASIGRAGAAILLIALVAVAVALYVFVRQKPDDSLHD